MNFISGCYSIDVGRCSLGRLDRRCVGCPSTGCRSGAHHQAGKRHEGGRLLLVLVSDFSPQDLVVDPFASLCISYCCDAMWCNVSSSIGAQHLDSDFTFLASLQTKKCWIAMTRRVIFVSHLLIANCLFIKFKKKGSRLEMASSAKRLAHRRRSVKSSEPLLRAPSPGRPPMAKP